jgi:glycosyltransferase involved in cell wall biosynthesis
LLPWLDRWVLKQLQPGDHIISSYGYTNRCFEFVRRHGGKTFVDAGNSHIENFWAVLSEEHQRWNCSHPPVSRFWYERSRAMLAAVDYVLSPSSYVTQSFLARGFKPERILHNPYPVDLSTFHPSTAPRPKERPLTIINTGSLSLRKGTPYLLEAFRLVRQQQPAARFLLTRVIQNDAAAVVARYNDLPIEWAPMLAPAQLADRLREADVFVLPSLEEGLVRTALEGLACGLQVVLTSHCGANDFVRPGVNGEVVPIRDPAATAAATLKCWDRIQKGWRGRPGDVIQQLSVEAFATRFLEQLRHLGLAPGARQTDSR